jgi:hypothetical protein
VEIDGRAVSLHHLLIHTHEWAFRKGIPRFHLPSHVQAGWLNFDKWLILEMKPFLESEPFRSKFSNFRKIAESQK